MNNKRLQIFIASSAELSPERDASSLLIFDLSEHGRGAEGVALYPMRWEEMDAAVRYHRHKNEDYKDEVRKSAFFIALFWKSCGQYTLDELDLALAQQAAGELPSELLLLIKHRGGEHAEAEAAMEQQLRAQGRGVRGHPRHLMSLMQPHINDASLHPPLRTHHARRQPPPSTALPTAAQR